MTINPTDTTVYTNELLIMSLITVLNKLVYPLSCTLAQLWGCYTTSKPSCLMCCQDSITCEMKMKSLGHFDADFVYLVNVYTLVKSKRISIIFVQ